MSLLKQFQDFSPSEWKGMKAGLKRISEACEAFGHPEKRFPSIHIAGTNGKGSVAAMLHSILSEAGMKVGLFTSPHLVRVNERFRVGREEMTDGELQETLETITDKYPFPSQGLTFFELCTLVAFLSFAEKKVDIAVLETGLGGRLDATNVVQPSVSVITEISLDHTEILGDDLPSIAREKAGIVKPMVPLVCGTTDEEARKVIAKTAEEKGAPIFWPERDLKDLDVGLPGEHQRRNAAIALKTLEVLKNTDAFRPWRTRLSESAIRDGLARVRWPGRLEWLSRNPPVVLDGAHNPAGVKALADYLQEKKNVKWKVLFSSAKDKDVPGMLKILRTVSGDITVCPIASERSIDPKIFSADTSLHTAEAAVKAYQRILDGLKPGEGLVVTGSLYLVGEIKKFTVGEPRGAQHGGGRIPRRSR